MADITQLRQNLLDALLSQEARKIDFCVGTIHVDANAFVEVFGNVVALKLGVVVESLPGQQTNAIYNRRRNAFLFPASDYGGTPDQKAAMIHESVHAFTDLRNMHWNRYFEDEVAGYIAEMLFLQYTTGKTAKQFVAEIARKRNDPTIKLAPHEEMACDIAAAIAGKAGAVVSADDIKRLSKAIHDQPDYQNIDLDALAGANGI